MPSRTRCLVLSVLLALPLAAGATVGFRRLSVPDTSGGRALEVAVWYPALDGGRPELVGDNPAFVGVASAVEAPPAAGRHPLVLLSHGYGGNWSNEGWLAAELVREGYIVAAPNHPGTTSRDMRPVTFSGLLERPRDLSRLLDQLTNDPSWSALIDSGRVAAIGHSLGGWTVMELAGARLDPGRLAADCRLHPQLAASKVAEGLDFAKAPAEEDRADPRIKAVVTLDIGLSRGFDPASLAAVVRPVLVIAAGADRVGVPARLESETMASLLPASRTRELTVPGAAHFSFLTVCKPGAGVLLEQNHPGDGVICLDGEGGDRAALHARFAGEIRRFLAAALPPR
jgi:predicted dienelactone hydrolase